MKKNQARLHVEALDDRSAPAMVFMSWVALNPQPLPPRQSAYGINPGGTVMLNPQPLPPKFMLGMFGMFGRSLLG